MNLDINGYPVQADGDNTDTLNRIAILALSDAAWLSKVSRLESEPGVYVRAIGRSSKDVSGDQLVPVFAVMMRRDHQAFNDLTKQLFKRFGFAQNTQDTTPGKKKVGPPDFLLHRVLPFIARVYAPRIRILADLVLLINTLFTILDLRLRKDPDHVDPYVNSCATLWAVNYVKPTILSRLSAKLLDKYAPPNLGSTLPNKLSKNVQNGLLWYHRAAAGGNPEVGDIQAARWYQTVEML